MFDLVAMFKNKERKFYIFSFFYLLVSDPGKPSGVFFEPAGRDSFVIRINAPQEGSVTGYYISDNHHDEGTVLRINGSEYRYCLSIIMCRVPSSLSFILKQNIPFEAQTRTFP